MLQTDKNVIQVQNAFQKIRMVVNTIVTLVVLLAFAYFMYWIVITNDWAHSYDGTEQYFLPLATFFFPDDANSKLIYQHTAFALVGCALPVIFVYYLLDVVKDWFIKSVYMVKDYENRQLQKRLKTNQLLQYEVIKHISICLNLNWESDDNLSETAITKLNIGLFDKIKNTLMKTNFRKNITIGKTLVITLGSFGDFDTMLELLMNVLAKVKIKMEKGGKFEMIPTITVDAFPEAEPTNNIEKRHFKIMAFNFKNKVLSSSMFVKKYNYLGLKKYKGYSIGDYSNFDDTEETMELNVIFDNLNEELEKINERSR